MKSLKGKLSFQKVFQQGVWITRRTSPVRVKILPLYEKKHQEECTLGVIASKKVGNAVQRNKARRQTREIIREFEKSLGITGTIVVVLSHEFRRFEYQEKKSRLLRIFKSFLAKSC